MFVRGIMTYKHSEQDHSETRSLDQTDIVSIEAEGLK